MGGRTKGDTVPLAVKLKRRGHGDDRHCLIFIVWNYYEDLVLITTNS